jgi:hypothetical protein
MRKMNYIFAIVIILLGISCSNKSSDPNVLQFGKINTQNKEIIISATMTGTKIDSRLHLKIEFENLSNKVLVIEEIKLYNLEGVESRVESILPSLTSIDKNESKTHELIFQSIEDAKIFEISGEPGAFKNKYRLSITYRDESNISQKIPAAFSVDELAFNRYVHDFRSATVYYFLNEDSVFEKNQKIYQTNVLQQSGFVKLSENEVAIAGLNFQIKTYQKRDTIFSKIMMVNHADFSVKIQPNNFDVLKNGVPFKSKTIKFEKIDSHNSNEFILRKGDRGILYFESPYKQPNLNLNKLSMVLKDVLILPNGKTLFINNLNLDYLK